MTDLELELAEIAASSMGLPERADTVLTSLRSRVPFDAAWMALADTRHPRYTTLASSDLDDSVVDYFQGPLNAADIEATGTNRKRPPLSPSDLPYPRAELRTWSECLLPAGINEGLGVALFEPGGRHVGFLALLYGAKTRPPRHLRLRLGRATSVIGRAIDPMEGLTSMARLVTEATSGVVVLRDGSVEGLPGLPRHPLLRAGATVLELARAHLDAGHTHTTFLWPVERERVTHARVTIFGSTRATPTMHLGVIVLSVPTGLRGLTPRELQVLGYVIDGCSNQEISHQLVLAPRTVAAHLEHILAKLEAPTRTMAAVRACREGLYVPVSASRGVPCDRRETTSV